MYNDYEIHPVTSPDVTIPDAADTGSAPMPKAAGDGLDSATTSDAAPTAAAENPVAAHPRRRRKEKRSIFVKVEAFVSRLSTRNNFWNRVCSMIWMPYAFHSGIRMKRLDSKTFQAELPFRRFNRNWYNAMAGAALLGNSEIAGGSYIFSTCGGDYTVVCKHLEYKFLRPCLGPAIYKITPREDLEAQVSSGGEFNAILDMRIVQAITKPGSKERRVGQCTATFHITPKKHQRSRGRLK